MKKIAIKIIITIGVIMLALVLLFLFKPNISSKKSGTINIVIIDKNDSVISNKMIKFEENDTLWDLIKANYDNSKLVYEKSTFGIVLYQIESIATDFSNTYLRLEVDGVYSSLGISSIKLYDKMVLKIIESDVIK